MAASVLIFYAHAVVVPLAVGNNKVGMAFLFTSFLDAFSGKIIIII